MKLTTAALGTLAIGITPLLCQNETYPLVITPIAGTGKKTAESGKNANKQGKKWSTGSTYAMRNQQ